MSNKATNKFARFTAMKPPLYKYNRLGASNITKKGQSKIVAVTPAKDPPPVSKKSK